MRISLRSSQIRVKFSGSIPGTASYIRQNLVNGKSSNSRSFVCAVTDGKEHIPDDGKLNRKLEALPNLSIPEYVYQDLAMKLLNKKSQTKQDSPDEQSKIASVRTKSSSSDATTKTTAKIDYVSAIKSAFKTNQFGKVLNIWKMLSQAANNIRIDYDLLEILTISADKLDRNSEVNAFVDLYFSQRTSIISTREAKQFLELCSSKLKTGWLQSTKLLSFFTQSRSLVEFHDFQHWYLEIAELCSKRGKWRTCIEVVKMMAQQGLSFNSQILTVAILACCKDNDSGTKAVIEAVSIFDYMVRNNIPRNHDLYHRLLRSLNREKLFANAKSIWVQLLIDSSVTGNAKHVDAGSQYRPILMTDSLYATHITTLCGLGCFEEAMEVYKLTYSRIKMPMHSSTAIFVGLKNACLFREAESLLQSHPCPLSTLHITNCLKSFINDKDMKAAVSYLINELTEKDVKVIPLRLVNEIYDLLLQGEDVDGAIALLEKLRKCDEDSEQTYPSGSIGSSLNQLTLNTWHTKIMRSLGETGEVDKALALSNNDLPDDAALALFTLLIRNGQFDAALNQLKKRYVDSSKNGSVQRCVPYSVGYHLIKVTVSEMYYEFLPAILKVIRDSFTEHSVIMNLKGANNIGDREFIELKNLYTAAFRELEKNSKNAYIGLKAADVIFQILDQEHQTGLIPSWTQLKHALGALSVDISANSTQIVHLFGLRTYTENYIPGDDRMYELAMNACGFSDKFSYLTVEFFWELLREKKRPSDFIFECVIAQLAQKYHTIVTSNKPDSQAWQQKLAGSIADIYKLMQSLKIQPTHKTENLLLKCLPKDMKNQLQRDIALRVSIAKGLSTDKN